MPYWVRDIEGRLVRIETPQDIELEICLNIMDVPQEDQNSQHGQEPNPNALLKKCLDFLNRYHVPIFSGARYKGFFRYV